MRAGDEGRRSRRGRVGDGGRLGRSRADREGRECGFENEVVLMGLGVYFIKYDFFKITTSLIFNEREFSSN